MKLTNEQTTTVATTDYEYVTVSAFDAGGAALPQGDYVLISKREHADLLTVRQSVEALTRERDGLKIKADALADANRAMVKDRDSHTDAAAGIIERIAHLTTDNARLTEQLREAREVAEAITALAKPMTMASSTGNYLFYRIDEMPVELYKKACKITPPKEDQSTYPRRYGWKGTDY